MRRGFSLVELLLTVSIAVTIAAVVVPLALDQESGVADGTARILYSDLEHAQMLAVANPEYRIALSVDVDGGGWRIVDADHPMQPWIDSVDAHATGRPLEVRLGHGRAAPCAGASVSPAGTVLTFDPLGGLEIPGGPDQSLVVQAGDRTRLVRIDPDTGFVSIVSP